MLSLLTFVIFGIAFLFIIFEWYDKSIIALGGALLMIFCGILTPEEAYHAIEYETILLLMAMMLLVNISAQSGIFNWLSIKIAKITRGNPLAIFILFSLVTAILSAFLDNVTTVILIIPITIQLINGMGKDPKPFIMAEIIFSNIGGALTLIGDPPNIIIGGATGFSFLDFIVNLWIPILFSLIFSLLIFCLVYWKKIKPNVNDLIELHIANILIKKIQYTFIKKPMHLDFIIKSIGVLLLTVGCFLVRKWIGVPTYLIAFGSAILLAFLTANRIQIHKSFESVEWTTLFFFGGLFIMVAGIEKTGILETLSFSIAHSTSNLFYLALMILWISGFVSMILDNIPFVTIMIPVILGIQSQFNIDTSILWWALSLGACLGGNATLVGASANLVSVGIAKKHNVNISFFEYMKFSLPLTISILILCSVYLFFVIN